MWWSLKQKIVEKRPDLEHRKNLLRSGIVGVALRGYPCGHMSSQLDKKVWGEAWNKEIVSTLVSERLPMFKPWIKSKWNFHEESQPLNIERSQSRDFEKEKQRRTSKNTNTLWSKFKKIMTEDTDHSDMSQKHSMRLIDLEIAEANISIMPLWGGRRGQILPYFEKNN